ncbi:MAG: dienelactone hydrolase family protein [Pseudomonadota bacterium]
MRRSAASYVVILAAWRHRAPALFILASEDVIAPADQCADIVRDLEQTGFPVEMLMLEGANHGFDQQERSELSPLVYDAAFTEAAARGMRTFLDGLLHPAKPEGARP